MVCLRYSATAIGECRFARVPEGGSRLSSEAYRTRRGRPTAVRSPNRGLHVWSKATVRTMREQHVGSRDPDVSQEMYDDDAVLEFPESGERFV